MSGYLNGHFRLAVVVAAQKRFYCTVKQNVRFQESMYLEKWPPIGHYSLLHGRYLVNRARWLDHHHRRNVRFQLRMHLGKFRLDQIQNGHL